MLVSIVLVTIETLKHRNQLYDHLFLPQFNSIQYTSLNLFNEFRIKNI